MEHSYENRGKIAFIQDQAQLAAVAFQVGDMQEALKLLEALELFLGTFLEEVTPKRK